MASNVCDFAIHRSIKNLRLRVEALDAHINEVKSLWRVTPQEVKNDADIVLRFINSLRAAIKSKRQALCYIKILQRGLDADVRA